jgi:hypothetical protein
MAGGMIWRMKSRYDLSTVVIVTVVSPALYPHELRRLIVQQNKLRWRQLFNGRFSVEWSSQQDDYYQRSSSKSEQRRFRSGLKWQIRLIGLLWDHWWRIWQVRNQDVHGHDETTREQAARREVEGQLRNIYEARHDLEPSVQQILRSDVEQQLQQPVWVNRNWVAIHAPIIRDSSVRRVRERAIKGVCSIATYFRPRTGDNNLGRMPKV